MPLDGPFAIYIWVRAQAIYIIPRLPNELLDQTNKLRVVSLALSRCLLFHPLVRLPVLSFQVQLDTSSAVSKYATNQLQDQGIWRYWRMHT